MALETVTEKSQQVQALQNDMAELEEMLTQRSGLLFGYLSPVKTNSTHHRSAAVRTGVPSFQRTWPTRKKNFVTESSE